MEARHFVVPQDVWECIFSLFSRQSDMVLFFRASTVWNPLISSHLILKVSVSWYRALNASIRTIRCDEAKTNNPWTLISINRLKLFVNLTSLRIGGMALTNDGLRGFTSLTTLWLCDSKKVTDPGIETLTRLTSLDLSFNNGISDAGLARHTQLTRLNLSFNMNISDVGVKSLKNLTYLKLKESNMTDEGLKCLTQLTVLYLDDNSLISNRGIHSLTNLTSLSLVETDLVNDDGISHLTNLLSLNLGCAATPITRRGLSCLPKLQYLNLSFNRGRLLDGIASQLDSLTSLNLTMSNVSDNSLMQLTNLIILDLTRNACITDAGLARLFRLTSLNLSYNKYISDAGVRNLTNLLELNLRGNAMITEACVCSLPYLSRQ